MVSMVAAVTRLSRKRSGFESWRTPKLFLFRSNTVVGSTEYLDHFKPCRIYVDQGSDYDGPELKLFILVGLDQSSFVYCLVHRGSTDDLLLLQISSGVVWQSRDLQLSCNTLYLLSPRLCFFIVLTHDLFVYPDDLLTS